jgi:hypothetical protein
MRYYFLALVARISLWHYPEMMKKSHRALLLVFSSLTVCSLSACTNDLYANDWLGLHGYPKTPVGIDETPQANVTPQPAPMPAPAPTPLVNHSILDDRDTDLPPPPPKKHPVDPADAS